MTNKGIIATLKDCIRFPISIHRIQRKQILVKSSNIDEVHAIMQKYPQFSKEITPQGLVIGLDGDGSGCPKCHYGELDITIKLRMPGYLDTHATKVMVGPLTFERETTIVCKACRHRLDMPLDRYPIV